MHQWESLVHLLQLERGCSCAWVASGGKVFEVIIISHRSQVTGLLRLPEHSELRERVTALRSKADDVVRSNADSAELAHAFYETLAGYTDLIASLLDDRTTQPGSFLKGSSSRQVADAFGSLK